MIIIPAYPQWEAAFWSCVIDQEHLDLAFPEDSSTLGKKIEILNLTGEENCPNDIPTAGGTRAMAVSPLRSPMRAGLGLWSPNSGGV